ncbi:MAG: RNA 2',3'-cyclic phosphodiesterase [archaeon]
MRCFISIDIPEKVQKEIIRIQEQLPEFYGKKTEPENLHLTLKFLGEISEERVEEIKKRLEEIKFNKVEAEIDSLGVFSEKFIRIIWLHLANCEGLQKKIDESLGDLLEQEKKFMSHLTIARVKNVRDKKKFLEELDKIKTTEIKFIVSSFKLKESVLKPERVMYKTLQNYFLD